MTDDTKGTEVDADAVMAVAAAVKETASKFTYMGINVGSYITDAECREVATSAIIAYNNFKNAPGI